LGVQGILCRRFPLRRSLQIAKRRSYSYNPTSCEQCHELPSKLGGSPMTVLRGRTSASYAAGLSSSSPLSTDASPEVLTFHVLVLSLNAREGSKD
jgi:hypothetical protein